MKKLIYVEPLAALMLMVTVIPSAFATHSVSPNACYNDGLDTGQNGEFSQELYEFCEQYGENYYQGFIDGCESAGNDLETCESATDAGE